MPSPSEADAPATAIELQASADAASVHGIGGFMGLRGGTTALTLRDQTGHTYSERARARPSDQLPGSHSGTVALFERLHDEARVLELEIPFVCIDETRTLSRLICP